MSALCDAYALYGADYDGRDQSAARQPRPIGRMTKKGERDQRVAGRRVAAWKAAPGIGWPDKPVEVHVGKAAVRFQIPRAVMAGGLFQQVDDRGPSAIANTARRSAPLLIALGHVRPVPIAAPSDPIAMIQIAAFAIRWPSNSSQSFRGQGNAPAIRRKKSVTARSNPVCEASQALSAIPSGTSATCSVRTRFCRGKGGGGRVRIARWRGTCLTEAKEPKRRLATPPLRNCHKPVEFSLSRSGGRSPSEKQVPASGVDSTDSRQPLTSADCLAIARPTPRSDLVCPGDRSGAPGSSARKQKASQPVRSPVHRR